jgi:hypothetical protein
VAQEPQVFVYRNMSWQYTDSSFSFETSSGLAALNAASAQYGPILDADADLPPFEQTGGKILFYQGCAAWPRRLVLRAASPPAP